MRRADAAIEVPLEVVGACTLARLPRGCGNRVGRARVTKKELIVANPFAHIELNTDDVAQAKKFYKKVFAWKLKDAKGMPYTMIDVGKGVGGGMQKKPMPGPTSWVPYVEVDSVKKSIARAKKAGGNVLMDYMAIGDMGAVGVFADPGGAILGVWEAAKKPAKKAKSKKKSAKKR
jgi:predicted enzyme related to lactoylglutathione lyase